MKRAQCGPRNLLTKVVIFVAIALVLEAVSLYHSSDVPDFLQPFFVGPTTQTDSVNAKTSILIRRECKRGECKQSDLKGTVDHEPTNTSAASRNRTVVAAPTTAKLHNFSAPSTRDPINERSTTQGYLLAVQYEQQLSGGFNSFAQLSKIASLLNLSTVEPYIYGTSIQGAPEIQFGQLRSQLPVQLTELYERHHLQSTLKSCCALTRLVRFKDMLENTAHHNIIFVVVFTSKNNLFDMFFGRNPNKHKIIEKHLNENYGAVHYTYNILERWVSHISRKLKVKQLIQLKLSRIVAVDARPLHPLHLSTVTSVLGSIIHEEVEKYGSTTVVLDKWRGIHSTGNSSFFSYIPEFSWDNNCGLNSIQHSEAVVKAAHQFSQTLSGTRPVIGVHIRGERLLTESKGNVSYYTDCLQQLSELLHQLAISRNVSHESIHVFHDLGNYGSLSCTLKFCVEGRRHFLSQVMKLGFPNISYDPVLSNSVLVSSGFAAFVEREYLSHVDVLVTVGRGGFQQSIVERFKNNSNVHRICQKRLNLS